MILLPNVLYHSKKEVWNNLPPDIQSLAEHEMSKNTIPGCKLNIEYFTYIPAETARLTAGIFVKCLITDVFGT